MKKLLGILLIAGMLTGMLARGQTGLSNPGFEQGSPGQSPPGWFIPKPSTDAGYVVQISTDDPKEGNQCASIELVTPKGQGFGNMMQSIDATPFRGKRVRFRAAVRFNSGGGFGQAQLWLRVDRAGGAQGFFNNMGDRPITSPTWAYYDIAGNIDNDAQTINFGMLLAGSGKAWIDSVSLRVADAKPLNVVKARALTDRGLENLVAYTKLLGYVRHFHPSDAVEKADWNAYAIAGVLAAEDATDPANLAARLQKFFQPLAPTVRVFVTGATPEAVDLAKPSTGHVQVVSWQNIGFGGGTNPPGQNVYRSRRLFVDLPSGPFPAGVGDPRVPFRAELGGGVSCSIPLALYAIDGSALPHTEDPKLTNDPDDLTGDDRTTRLADVALAWNIYQHFYPYFDVVKTDWNAVLPDALTSAATDSDDRAFLSPSRRCWPSGWRGSL
jgi:hypothetical protein